MSKSRSLVPKNGNDKVYTPEYLAKAIIAHFKPFGPILDPCRGKGAFYNNFPTNIWNGWYEIDEGRDFLNNPCLGEIKYQWILTNPPYSLFRKFLKRSMEVADNVVFLCPINHVFLKARMRDIQEAKFGIKEILLVDTPPKPWPQSGFQIGVVLLCKNYQGDTKISKLKT